MQFFSEININATYYVKIWPDEVADADFIKIIEGYWQAKMFLLMDAKFCHTKNL